jgi:Sulfotransferase domain
MALDVVGTGLGRTGTKSLQIALEQIGFGPCHHMTEVFKTPESVALWIAAASGPGDWETIFKTYRAAVDYPTAGHWRAIIAAFPNAKVIHTTRDPEAWFESTQATIFSPTGASAASEQMRPFAQSFLGPIHPHLHDRDYLIDHFKRHDEAVRREVPADRLLVFEAAMGWEPLCAFLGVPVPAEPYPSENSRAAFQEMVRKMNMGETLSRGGQGR